MKISFLFDFVFSDYQLFIFLPPIVINKLYNKNMTKIAIFASGSGTNAENLMRFFAKTDVQITKVYCNKEGAEVLNRAKGMNIPTMVFNKQEFMNTSVVLDDLQKDNVEYIILAGFLWLIPQNLIKAYPHQIINIHPSLLPKYGGKGMYGSSVHQAVIENKEVESGITIHLVNEVYDSGKVIFQARCAINDNSTPEELELRIHELEYEHLPPVIMAYIEQQKEG